MPSTSCGFRDQNGVRGSDYLVFHGPTLAVHVGFDPNHKDGSAAAPNLVAQDLFALVDTGATESCIDSGLAMQLNLPVVDQREVGGVGGRLKVNMHLGQIYIPSLHVTIYGQFAGVALQAGGQRHSALSGRSFLKNFTMTYDGRSGDVVISS
jgi:predicted aspartyl protease